MAESQGQCWPLDDPQHQLQTQGGGSLLLSLGPVAQSLGYPPPNIWGQPQVSYFWVEKARVQTCPKGTWKHGRMPPTPEHPVSTALELTRQGSLADVGAPVDECVPVLGGKLDPAHCTVKGQEAQGSLGRTQRPDSSPRSPRPRTGVISQAPVGRELGVRPQKAACGYWNSRDLEYVRVGEKLNKKMPVLGNGCPERWGRGAEVQGQKPHCQFWWCGLWRVSQPR